jgi:hypothetical protein
MSDLIDRQAAIIAICEDGTWLERQGCNEITLCERKQRDADILSELPTVDAVEVVHAHWEQDSHGTLYCSRCGKPTYDSHDVPIEFNGMKGIALVWPYYCGFCGANMDGGDKNAIS